MFIPVFRNNVCLFEGIKCNLVAANDMGMHGNLTFFQDSSYYYVPIAHALI